MRFADGTSNSNTGPSEVNSSDGPYVIIYLDSYLGYTRPPTPEDLEILGRAMKKMAGRYDCIDPCKPEPRPASFSNPHQTRPSRSKNKVPYLKRVAKRRRRTKLAKLHKKKIKEALARKAKLKLQAANAGHHRPEHPTSKPRR